MHTAHLSTRPTTTTGTTPIDTGEMGVVHSMFRREVRLAGDLVRRVETGDTRRSGVVAAHLDLIDRCLHHHHVTEDELLWPLLLARAAADVTPIVDLMESQHHEVAALLARSEHVRAEWAVTADAVVPRRTRRARRPPRRALVEHLDDEESRVLPIAATCLSQSEWDSLGDAGRKGPQRSERTLVFGMMQHDGDPRVVATMLGDAPKPVRLLIPRLARRAFRKHSLAVHGTATPDSHWCGVADRHFPRSLPALGHISIGFRTECARERRGSTRSGSRPRPDTAGNDCHLECGTANPEGVDHE